MDPGHRSIQDSIFCSSYQLLLSSRHSSGYDDSQVGYGRSNTDVEDHRRKDCAAHWAWTIASGHDIAYAYYSQVTIFNGLPPVSPK